MWISEMVGQSAKPRVLLNDNEKHYTRKHDCAKQRKHRACCQQPGWWTDRFGSSRHRHLGMATAQRGRPVLVLVDFSALLV